MHSKGRYVRFFVMIAIISLVLTLGCSTPPPKEQSPQSLSGAALVLSTYTWKTGGDLGGVTVKGSGFAPGEQVELMIVNAFDTYSFGLGGGQNYVPWATNSSGAFVVTFAKSDAISSAIKPGVYTFQVTGKQSKTTATVPIELTK